MSTLLERLKLAQQKIHEKAAAPAAPPTFAFQGDKHEETSVEKADAAPPAPVQAEQSTEQSAAVQTDSAREQSNGAEAVESAVQSPAAPLKSGFGFRAPAAMPKFTLQATGLRAPGLAPGLVQTETPAAEAPEQQPAPANNVLSALMAHGSGSANALAGFTKKAVTPAAARAVDAGVTYTPEQYLQDVRDLGDAPPADELEETAAHNAALAALVRRAGAEMDRMLNAHMEGLKTDATTSIDVKTLAQLVNITFMRLRTASTAWLLLTLDEQAKVTRALIRLGQLDQQKALARPSQAAKSAAAADAAYTEAALGEELLAGVDLSDFGL